jgi:hypothetical protein
MVLTNEILSPNHRAIFARCLDSQLRFVLQVIAGLSLPSDRHILVERASLRAAMCVRWTQGGHGSRRAKNAQTNFLRQ